MSTTKLHSRLILGSRLSVGVLLQVELDGAQYAGLSLPFDIWQLIWIEVRSPAALRQLVVCADAGVWPRCHY